MKTHKSSNYHPLCAIKWRKGDDFLRRHRNSGEFIFACLIVAGFALLISYGINTKLEPMITEMGASKVIYAAKAAMNEAVTELMTNGTVNYDKIVSFEKDDNGGITAVKTDVAEINNLKAETTEAVLERIGNISVEELAVPVGNLLAVDYLSGIGPEIPVKIIAVRTAAVDFVNDFSTAGINQTVHRIYLNFDVEITILAAGKKSAVEASSMFCIAETVVVGTVPESYTYFSETETANDAMEKYFNFT